MSRFAKNVDMSLWRYGRFYVSNFTVAEVEINPNYLRPLPSIIDFGHSSTKVDLKASLWKVNDLANVIITRVKRDPSVRGD